MNVIQGKGTLNNVRPRGLVGDPSICTEVNLFSIVDHLLGGLDTVTPL